MTPMIRQYYEIKKKHQDAILFFRLGDFYEMFDEDALIASQILGIVLTARNKGDEKIPMCGVPYHAAANYIAKLTRQGKKVAICEQLSDPSQVGIVERDVIKIITPGTTLDEQVLDQKSANYIAAIISDAGMNDKNKFAFAFADITTGEFKSSELENFQVLLSELEKLQPIEIIATPDFLSGDLGKLLKKKNPTTHFFDIEPIQDALSTLDKHFNQAKPEHLRHELEMKATAMLLNYLQTTQKNDLEHLKDLRRYETTDYMALDEATIKNLELLKSSREHTLEGSLLGVLDKTITSGGGRLLKKFIIQPLTQLAALEERLDIVEYFLQNQVLLLDIRNVLKKVGDIERMLGRLSLNSGNARDLRGIFNTFMAIKEIKELLITARQFTLNSYAQALDTLPDLMQLIERSIAEEPPLSTRDGGMIKEGFDDTLDEYKKINREGKNFIQALQAREIQRTGINSLKIKFNKVFGYYIEISNANLKDVPADYTRKQTLVNAERFSIPELKEYEEKVLGAEEKIIALEQEIFEKIKLRVLVEIKKIQSTAQIISLVDVLSTFGVVSWENKYCRPRIHADFDLHIQEGRHPVVEKIQLVDNFVSNDLELTQQESLMLITGPNMGGKSTYLRQTALITLMAHLGIFVPARSAQIPLVDRIFTRVGASDNLVKGQSTFWVEMEETALILKNATERSLLVLDEIGRGTSTFDGVSIAWGIMEYIHNHIGAKTLFASHYHELISLADKLLHAANYSVLVEENETKGVIFLYKVVRGGVDKSYGIEVAKLAGLPPEVIERAKEILTDLEKEVVGTARQPLPLIFEKQDQLSSKMLQEVTRPLHQESAETLRESSSESLSNKALLLLKNLDVNNITPLDALNTLHQLKREIDQ